MSRRASTAGGWALIVLALSTMRPMTSTAFSLRPEDVHPRIVTPNGDGVNDAVILDVDNPRLSPVEGRVLDVGGGFVATLRSAGLGGPLDALQWDGRDDGGRPVSAGVYIYEVWGEGRRVTGAVTVAR
jgi:hypothetical protein